MRTETVISGTLRKRTRLTEVPSETCDKISAARAAGKSLRAIAADFALSHGSVRKLLKNEGVNTTIASPARLPRRPRNGQAALPDFQRLARLTAKGKTVKEVWRAYAQETPKAYCYTHFSTLFRRWLQENKQTAPSKTGAGKRTLPPAEQTASSFAIPDYTADEDAIAEDYWKNRIDPRANVHALYGNACTLKVYKGELVSLNARVEGRRFPRSKRQPHPRRRQMVRGARHRHLSSRLVWRPALRHAARPQNRRGDQEDAVLSQSACDGEGDPRSEVCRATPHRKALSSFL